MNNVYNNNDMQCIFHTIILLFIFTNGADNTAGYCIVTIHKNSGNVWSKQINEDQYIQKVLLECSIQANKCRKADCRIAQLSLQCHATHASCVLLISFSPASLSAQWPRLLKHGSTAVSQHGGQIVKKAHIHKSHVSEAFWNPPYS